MWKQMSNNRSRDFTLHKYMPAFSFSCSTLFQSRDSPSPLFPPRCRRACRGIYPQSCLLLKPLSPLQNRLPEAPTLLPPRGNPWPGPARGRPRVGSGGGAAGGRPTLVPLSPFCRGHRANTGHLSTVPVCSKWGLASPPPINHFRMS